jgi:hypothetical protein
VGQCLGLAGHADVAGEPEQPGSGDDLVEGGDAFEGLALYQALRDHSGPVTVEVFGLAASAASIIACAGREVVMHQGSMIMVHSASCMVWGQAVDLRAAADLLDKVDLDIARIYSTRSGGRVSDWLEAMARETWLGAQEAVDAGLADRVAAPTARAHLRPAARACMPTLSQRIRAGVSMGLHKPPVRVTSRRPAPSAMASIRALHARGARPRGVAR